MLRRLFEIDCADNSGMITLGETNDGDRVSLTLVDNQRQITTVILDEESFKSLTDLRYKLDFPLKPVQTHLRLSQIA
jgi:hypothetical protein